MWPVLWIFPKVVRAREATSSASCSSEWGEGKVALFSIRASVASWWDFTLSLTLEKCPAQDNNCTPLHFCKQAQIKSYFLQEVFPACSSHLIVSYSELSFECLLDCCVCFAVLSQCADSCESGVQVFWVLLSSHRFFMHTCVYPHTHAHTHPLYPYVCVFVPISVHVCVYVAVCLFTCLKCNGLVHRIGYHLIAEYSLTIAQISIWLKCKEKCDLSTVIQTHWWCG